MCILIGIYSTSLHFYCLSLLSLRIAEAQVSTQFYPIRQPKASFISWFLNILLTTPIAQRNILLSLNKITFLMLTKLIDKSWHLTELLLISLHHFVWCSFWWVLLMSLHNALVGIFVRMAYFSLRKACNRLDLNRFCYLFVYIIDYHCRQPILFNYPNLIW